jgi:hypothetical protein
VISAHFSSDFIVAIKSIEFIGIFKKKVGHRRMVTGMFAVELGAIFELALECFS